MSTDSLNNPPRHLLLVHGRGFKPDAESLKAFWVGALNAGLARDFPEGEDLRDVAISMVYFGDLISDCLSRRGEVFDADLDKRDREKSLRELTGLDRARRFRRIHYDKLPGKSSIGEFLADIGMPLAHVLGLGERAMARLIPEISAYWKDRNGFAGMLDQRMTGGLTQALAGGRSVMIISHCLGSIAAYNALWTLSRKLGVATKVDNWVTLGSPLADETVKRHLKGAGEKGAARYPGNIVNWTNLSAEDDYICHDETIANDYNSMVKAQLISRIEDQHIYNLAVRYGKSNPHSAVGYLAHPRMAQILNDWLSASKEIV